MANLEFQMQMQDQSQPPEQGKQPAQASGFSGILKRSSHPTAIIFHYLFKALAVLCYFFLGIFTNNYTLIFILVVLLSAFDFWTVQNITGRLLVGLRWRNQVNEDGSEQWVFESFGEQTQSNSVDVYAFWIGVVAMPLIWGIFLLANILTFDLFWSMLMLVCLVLSGVNMMGYYKCRKDHKQKLAGLLKQGAFNAAMRV